MGTGSAWQGKHLREPLATGCTQPCKEGEDREEEDRQSSGLAGEGGAGKLLPPQESVLFVPDSPRTQPKMGRTS